MSKFQIALLVVFGAFILLAVIIFSRSKGNSNVITKLEVWGSMSAYDFANMLQTSGLAKDNILSYAYTEKAADKLDAEFTEALAEGRGPDLVILPLESLWKDRNKLYLISTGSIKQADFVSTYVKGGELFETPLGTYALPMYVDPMVLYWNRDMLAAKSFAAPPTYWDQIYDYVNKLTVKDGAGNITVSAMALGEAKNIPHYKDILSLLMLQAGTPITTYVGTQFRSVLLENLGLPQVPAISALDFYTQFANPQKSYYMWNRSLLAADTNFTSGKSAMYLGFASELPILKAKNPTADFAVAPVPQSRARGLVMTFGRIYGLAITRSAKNLQAALNGAVALTSKNTISALTQATPLVPARRDLLSQKPSNAAGFVFYGAALQAQGWVDPDPLQSGKIFKDMIEAVTSGRSRVDEAVGTANNALNSLLAK